MPDAFDLAAVHDLADVDPDHVANTELLDAELPDPRFVDAAYLHWLYDLNPLGRGIYDSVDSDDSDGGQRVAHYGLIPQVYRNAEGRQPFVFSLNAVSRSGAQRRGYFSEIGQKIWGRAQEQGVQMVIGVTNVNSTWPVKKLGWRVMGPLPVRLAVPRRGRARNVESYPVTPAWLDSAGFAEVAAGLDESPAWHWTNCWTPTYLRWRLASPNTPPYVVHVSPDVVAISTHHRSGGVTFAVILKLLPRHGRFGPLPSDELVAAICRHHKAPGAVYAGHNRHVEVRGIRLPEKLKPVPLNLDILGLSDSVDQLTFQLDTYEFLDMDAY